MPNRHALPMSEILLGIHYQQCFPGHIVNCCYIGGLQLSEVYNEATYKQAIGEVLFQSAKRHRSEQNHLRPATQEPSLICARP